MLRPSPNTPNKEQALHTAETRAECIRETEYADKQRSLCLQAQQYANEQNAAVMQRTLRGKLA